MKDLSNLPTKAPGPERKPVSHWTKAFAGHWMKMYKEAGRDRKPHAIEGSVIRGSWAGKCARRISYSVLGYEETNPPDVASFWRMELGTIAHDYWQATAVEYFGDLAVPERRGSLADGLISLHSDLVLEDTVDGRVLFELKTVGGYKFKLLVGAIGSGQEPDAEHVLQAALGAEAHDADRVVIAYIAQENVNKGWANDLEFDASQKFSCEFEYSREELRPLAEKEIVRLSRIAELAEAGHLAPRFAPLVMPPGARIVDIGKSMWTQRVDGEILATGSLWGGNYCQYCPYMEQCAADFLKEEFSNVD